MNTTSPRAIALASATCITAALLFGVSALFTSPAHAGEGRPVAAISAVEKFASRAVPSPVDPGRYLVQLAG